MPPKVHTEGLPKLGPGQRYVSGAEVFKDQIKDLPKRVLQPNELKDAFLPVLDHLENNPLPQDPQERLKEIDNIANTYKLAAFGYPTTFMKVCLGQLDKHKLWEIIDGGVGGSQTTRSVPCLSSPQDSDA